MEGVVKEGVEIIVRSVQNGMGGDKRILADIARAADPPGGEPNSPSGVNAPQTRPPRSRIERTLRQGRRQGVELGPAPELKGQALPLAAGNEALVALQVVVAAS